jgi:hypothetical protein
MFIYPPLQKKAAFPITGKAALSLCMNIKYNDLTHAAFLRRYYSDQVPRVGYYPLSKKHP